MRRTAGYIRFDDEGKQPFEGSVRGGLGTRMIDGMMVDQDRVKVVRLFCLLLVGSVILIYVGINVLERSGIEFTSSWGGQSAVALAKELEKLPVVPYAEPIGVNKEQTLSTAKLTAYYKARIPYEQIRRFYTVVLPTYGWTLTVEGVHAMTFENEKHQVVRVEYWDYSQKGGWDLSVTIR